MSKKSRRLLLLRHAKSSWKSDTAADYDRPLAKRGKRDASRVGLWLKRQKLIPDLILSSPAKRARNTSLAVCRELAFEADNIRWIREIYDASLNDLVNVLKTCPNDTKTVLLVGHNPGMEFLLEYLCEGRLPSSDDDKLLTTACVAYLVVNAKWSALTESAAQLLSITRPADME